MNDFFGKVKKLKNGCWEWTGAINSKGYGVIRQGKKIRLAHQVAFEQATGERIPVELTVDHRVDAGCIGARCVNYRHAQLVTRSVNRRLATLRRALHG